MSPTNRTPTGFYGYQYMIYGWILFIITTVFVCVRLYVQISLKSRPWRELLVICAWCGYTIVTIGDQLRASYGYYDYVEMNYDKNPHAVLLLKVSFMRLLLFRPVVYLCKAALLWFYMDLAPRHRHPIIWWNIVGAWFLVIFGAVFQVFFAFFTCRPLAWYWDPEHYMCYAVYWPYLFGWVIFLVNDLQVYAIPFFILYNLQSLTPRHKRAGYWMCAIGFINVGSACFMLAAYAIPSTGMLLGDDTARGISNGNTFMGPFQHATAIIIICLPQARRMWLGLSEVEMRQQLEEQLREAKTWAAGDDTRHSGATTLNVADLEAKYSRQPSAAGSDLEAQLELGEEKN